VLVPVLVPVLTFVFPFLVRSMPVPPAAPVPVVPAGIGVGPPQAPKTAAVNPAAPQSDSQLICLVICRLVMLTSLNTCGAE
jgi:hypothetical protein